MERNCIRSPNTCRERYEIAMQNCQAIDPNRVVAQGSTFVSHKVDSKCLSLEYHTSPLSPPSLSSWIHNQGKAIGSCWAGTEWFQLVQHPKKYTKVAVPPPILCNFAGYFSTIKQYTSRLCTDEHAKMCRGVIPRQSYWLPVGSSHYARRISCLATRMVTLATATRESRFSSTTGT